MEKTGDPTTRAPELCVEVMSETNTPAEMTEKRRLYREAGAEEVWIVDREGAVRFFGEEGQDQSALSPAFPSHVDAYVDRCREESRLRMSLLRCLFSTTGAPTTRSWDVR